MIDWDLSIFLFKVKQQEKDYSFAMLPSSLKISDNFQPRPQRIFSLYEEGEKEEFFSKKSFLKKLLWGQGSDYFLYSIEYLLRKCFE